MLETGISLPRGKGEIKYGDVLKSSMTHDVVVMHHKDNNTPIVKVVGENIWFTLDEFVKSWSTRLEIGNNVNFYCT